MNKSNNQRFQQTDEKIRQTFMSLLQDKTIEKITVGEICKLSGCNRSTFYAHFVDVYDLLDKIQMQIYQDIRERFHLAGVQTQNLFSPELLTVFLTHVQQNKIFYRAYFSSGRAAVDQPEKLLYTYFFQPNFARLGFDFGDDADSRRAWYHFRFFYDGQLSVIRLWLSADCPETPRQLADIIISSVASTPAQIPPFVLPE